MERTISERGLLAEATSFDHDLAMHVATASDHNQQQQQQHFQPQPHHHQLDARELQHLRAEPLKPGRGIASTSALGVRRPTNPTSTSPPRKHRQQQQFQDQQTVSGALYDKSGGKNAYKPKISSQVGTSVCTFEVYSENVTWDEGAGSRSKVSFVLIGSKCRICSSQSVLAFIDLGCV